MFAGSPPRTKVIEGRAIRILMVEDNPGDARLTLEAFKRDGVHNALDIVEDGGAALDYFYRRDHDVWAEQPDLLLLDLSLPGLDGRELLATLRADPRLQALPVIALTTSLGEEDVLRAQGLAVSGYATKPVDIEQLRRVMASVEALRLSVVVLRPEEPS